MNLLNLSRGAVITEVTHTFHPPKPIGEGGHTFHPPKPIGEGGHTHTHSVLKFLLATTLLFMMTASYAQKDNWILYPTRIDFDAGPGYSPAGFSNPNLTQPYAVENSVFDSETAQGKLIRK